MVGLRVGIDRVRQGQVDLVWLGRIGMVRQVIGRIKGRIIGRIIGKVIVGLDMARIDMVWLGWVNMIWLGWVWNIDMVWLV